MNASVVHAEIIGTDPDLLRGFYGALFGWDAAPGDPVAPEVSAPGRYSFNAGSGDAVPVGIGGGAGFAPRLLVYVGVEDVAATLDRAVELGATVDLAPALRPDGILRVARFADPEGNVVGIAGPA
jgi:uncharacterized protein